MNRECFPTHVNGVAPGGVVMLDPARTPALAGLVERVAAAVGAPAPRIFLLGYDLNAFTMSC
ncbi:hypothetical protein ACFY36_48405 [Actinoplanes sp. NPDC000266]